MPKWQNWSGRVTATPARLEFPRSGEDAAAIARIATSNGETIRVAGATHSHSPLVASSGVLADCKGLAGVYDVDKTMKTAWLGAGSRIYTLGYALAQHGLALANQGDIDEQAIAGATATGTHGTGASLTSLSAAVCGIEIATAAGELVRATPEENSEIWQAARLHLGAFGIVTQVALKLRDAYSLIEQSWQAPLEEILTDVDTLISSNRHFEFFWYPQEDRAQAKTLNETPSDPHYPVGAEGARCARSYEVLPNHRPHKHTEMEYSVPAENGAACMQELQKLLRSDFPDVQWPVEYRTLAADDVWLSTAYEQETVTLSVHQDVRADESSYYQACEELFLSYGGRPHWGKMNYLSGTQMADIHPRWQDWWRVRDGIDPHNTFLNDYLKGIRPQ